MLLKLLAIALELCETVAKLLCRLELEVLVLLFKLEEMPTEEVAGLLI